MATNLETRTLQRRMDIEVDFHFSAAHRLPLYEGPCFRMHGHNYKIRVTMSGLHDVKTGMVYDFGELQKVVQREVMPSCDHQTLNDIMENPTAENMIAWIWDKLAPHVPGLKELRLWENAEYCVIFRGERE
jgi:6-pyruvoyltetrahydropterin/6-carboxytetrahydropterin synthase